MENNYLK